MFAPFLRQSGDCVAPKEPQEIVTWFLVVVTEENVVSVGFKSGDWMSRKHWQNRKPNRIPNKAGCLWQYGTSIDPFKRRMTSNGRARLNKDAEAWLLGRTWEIEVHAAMS